MKCIPGDKLRTITLTQDNTKKVVSPPIKDTFSINTDGVYNYVLNAISNKHYDEVYKLIEQLKTIIRCTWKTYFSFARYPDIKYIKKVSDYPASVKPFGGNKTLVITPRTKELDGEILSIIHRNLVPSFDYGVTNFSDDLWDVYIWVYDNILMSEGIYYRKELKLRRDFLLKELSENKDENYQQRYTEITSEYVNNIESFKQDSIFKTVNFINWLYYNNENKDLAWAVVLLRLYPITGNIYHDEQRIHNENDFVNYIKQLKPTNDRELLELYIAITVYRYQFIHKNIVTYDKEYLDFMLLYLTGNQKTFDEYIASQFTNAYDNLPILRMLLPTDELMEEIKVRCLSKFNHKVKPLQDKLNSWYTKEELDKYNINSHIQDLMLKSEICKAFNRFTSNLYDSISASLLKYDKQMVLECFLTSYLSDYGPYTQFIIKYMLTLFGKEELSTEIKNIFAKNNKVNKSVNSL